MQSLSDIFHGRKKENDAMAQIQADAKRFKLPSEVVPEMVKYLVFATTAAFSVGLFMATLTGWRAYLTAGTAVCSEFLLLYCWNAFPRAEGLFRWVLGLTGAVLSVLALVHSTIAVIHFTVGRVNSETWNDYAHYVAFPLLMSVLAVGSILTMLAHPKKLVQMAQAAAHTEMAKGHAETASQLALIEQKKILRRAQAEELRAINEADNMMIDQLAAAVEAENRKVAILMQIEDPERRERIAREWRITLPSTPALPSHERQLLSGIDDRDSLPN